VTVSVSLEKDLSKDQFSMFFGGLEGVLLHCCRQLLLTYVTECGSKLTFRNPNANEPLLVVGDVLQYSHAIVFAPTIVCMISSFSLTTQHTH
jgi:hypothetical protein